MSGEVGYQHGAEGLPDGTLTLNLTGTAGHCVGEGVGDHGCEYMTGGTFLVLGRTGKTSARA